MAVNTYSKDTDGDKNLSANFKVKEFACKDGSNFIKIDSDLVAVLQKIRDFFGKALTITSAYRTESHNKNVGGASNSQHLFGKAADIVIYGVQPAEIAKYAESIGVKGIGLYEKSQNFVHVDTRTTRYYWINSGNWDQAVSTFGGASLNSYKQPEQTIKRGSSGEGVKWVQVQLIAKGYNCGKVDGIAGTNTDSAIRAFQRASGLTVDGIVGPKTREILK